MPYPFRVWERVGIPGVMPRKLKRYHGQGDLHFITFSCYERRALLGTVRARDLFLKILEQVKGRFASNVVGYVAMPEHVHLLLGEPKKGTLAKLMQGAEAARAARCAGEPGVE